MILSFAIKYFRPFRDIIGVLGCVYFLRKRPKAMKIRFHKCWWWENDNKNEIVYNYILIIYGYLNTVVHHFSSYPSQSKYLFVTLIFKFLTIYTIYIPFCAHFNDQGLVSVSGHLWRSLIQNNDTNNKGIMI